MNEKQCILAGVCNFAGHSDKCHRQCSSFIAIHGFSGSGGRVANAGVPTEYRLVTLHNSPAAGSQAEIYKRLRAYVDTFKRQFEGAESPSDRIKSLYLWSPSPGTGKTTTASALLNEWMIRHYVGSLERNRQSLQKPAFFLDVNQLQTDYNAFNRPRVPESIAEPAAERYYRAIEAAKQAPFAVLDDVGVRECTDGFRADLHSVVSHRVVEQRITVYTSNLPMSELAGVFGEQRLVDRMRDLCIEFYFEGESKRGLRK